MAYARGSKAIFICDMCGFQYPYKDRRYHSYGTVVCKTCYDGKYDLKNHPQNYPAHNTADPIALKDPRPDVEVEVSTTVSTKWGLLDSEGY